MAERLSMDWMERNQGKNDTGSSFTQEKPVNGNTSQLITEYDSSTNQHLKKNECPAEERNYKARS